MRKFVAITFFILVIAASGYCQIPTSGNIFFGYSHRGGDVFPNCMTDCPPGIGAFQPFSASAGFNGWEASLEGKFLPWIGAVVDVGRYYGSHNFTFLCIVSPNPGCPQGPFKVDSTLGTYLIGPRVSIPVAKFTPFAHLLLGAARVTDSGAVANESTSFATAIGGGLDYRLIHGLAWRIQGRRVTHPLVQQRQKSFRISTGIDVRF